MRTIDADAIPYKRDIVVTDRFPKFGGFNGKMVFSVTKEEIDAMPTTDAVPVVRCKDCARFDKKRGCNLVEGLNIAKTDSFCSYGERKDGDNEQNKKS